MLTEAEITINTLEAFACDSSLSIIDMASTAKNGLGMAPNAEAQRRVAEAFLLALHNSSRELLRKCSAAGVMALASGEGANRIALDVAMSLTMVKDPVQTVKESCERLLCFDVGAPYDLTRIQAILAWTETEFSLASRVLTPARLMVALPTLTGGAVEHGLSLKAEKDSSKVTLIVVPACNPWLQNYGVERWLSEQLAVEIFNQSSIAKIGRIPPSALRLMKWTMRPDIETMPLKAQIKCLLDGVLMGLSWGSPTGKPEHLRKYSDETYELWYDYVKAMTNEISGRNMTAR